MNKKDKSVTPFDSSLILESILTDHKMYDKHLLKYNASQDFSYSIPEINLFVQNCIYEISQGRIGKEPKSKESVKKTLDSFRKKYHINKKDMLKILVKVS